MRKTTKILVVEGHAMLAEALVVALRSHGYDVHRLLLEDHPDTAAVRLLPCALAVGADVVLLEPAIGRCGDGGVLIRPLTRAGTAVVVLTGVDDRPRWGGWLREGARAVVAKTEPLSKLLEVLRRLDAHLPVTSPTLFEELTDLWEVQLRDDEEGRQRLARLSRREQEVLGALMDGMTIREISALSVVSEATVRTQVRSILSKLGVCTQLAAVGVAHRLDWHAPPCSTGHGRALPAARDQRTLETASMAPLR